jgi:hypothetical protein
MPTITRTRSAIGAPANNAVRSRRGQACSGRTVKCGEGDFRAPLHRPDHLVSATMDIASLPISAVVGKEEIMNSTSDR